MSAENNISRISANPQIYEPLHHKPTAARAATTEEIIKANSRPNLGVRKPFDIAEASLGGPRLYLIDLIA